MLAIQTRYNFLDKDVLLKCFHAFVSFSIFYCIISSLIYIQVTEIEINKYEFLTHGFKNIMYLFSLWMNVLQVIYFNLYSAIDIIDIYSKQKPHLQSVKERLHDIASYLLFMAVFPLSLVVSILFWSFYWWNRELMYPPIMDELFPPVFNHIMHTFPVLFAVIYMFTSNKKEPPKTTTLAGLLALTSAYVLCVVFVKIKDGRWVYLSMERLTPFQLKCTLGLSMIGSVLFLFLGYLINDKIKVLRRKFMERTSKLHQE